MADEWEAFGESPRRGPSWVRRNWKTFSGYTILFTLLVVRDIWQNGEMIIERARNIRIENEMLAKSPDREPVPDAYVVRAADLVRTYRDTRKVADKAYTGQRIAVQLTRWTARGNAIYWHYTDQSFPPVLVFVFDRPASLRPGQTVWISGVCGGATRDGLERETGAMDFVIRVTDCKQEQ